MKNRHILSVLVEDHPGVLNRVVSLLRRRSFNIDSITVGHSEQPGVSRMTIVVIGRGEEVEQAGKQLYKLMEVLKVTDVTPLNCVAHELALIKVAGSGDSRAETLRLADAFRAQIVDATVESFVFEVTGKPAKIDSFIALMQPLGLVEVVRTGLAAISRGPQGM